MIGLCFDVATACRLGWLLLRERYLMRRVQRAARRWLACHAAMVDLLGVPEREDAAAVRTMLGIGL